MKCLIGILYSGESQFDACKAAIHSQSHTDWDMFEVSHLPKKEAHQTLFSTFSDNASKFDFFVKIDADMQLCHTGFLTALSHYFATHSDIDQVTMKVDDFYTARHIWGLNSFRSSVTFAENDAVYTDKAAQVEDHRIVRLKRHKALVPAALHGYNPSEYQAFYFGCHKAIKVMHRQSRSHMRNIRRLPMAALKIRDRRPLIAFAGAAMTFERNLEPGCLDHNNKELHEIFTQSLPAGAKLLGSLPHYINVVNASRSRFL